VGKPRTPRLPHTRAKLTRPGSTGRDNRRGGAIIVGPRLLLLGGHRQPLFRRVVAGVGVVGVDIGAVRALLEPRQGGDVGVGQGLTGPIQPGQRRQLRGRQRPAVARPGQRVQLRGRQGPGTSRRGGRQRLLDARVAALRIVVGAYRVGVLAPGDGGLLPT
jgi:hypothetical protein